MILAVVISYKRHQCRYWHEQPELEEVTSFKHMEATLRKDGTCSAEVRIRIASSVAAMARLNRIWRCDTISFTSKFKLYKTLVISVLLYD